jgi:hypothetical protein
VPAKTGRKDADVLNEILDTAAEWMTAGLLDRMLVGARSEAVTQTSSHKPPA